LEIIDSFKRRKRMKKLWLILLSLGLIMAFSVSAFAVDVKVSADYYVGGLYLNKTSVHDGFENNSDQFYNSLRSIEDPTPANPSTAFFYQRLRVGTDFIVSPGLKLVTRFDALERIWGGARSDPGDYDTQSAGTRAENQNITFDLVYIDYASPIGVFKVGYQPDIAWGTVFADTANGTPAGQIQYLKTFGPATLFIGYAKEVDNSWSAVSGGSQDATRTDRDLDSYRIGGIYNFKGGEAGALLIWNRDATNRGSRGNNNDLDHNYLSNVYVFDPYVKAKIGPVTLQAEAQYWFGDAKKYEGYVANAQNVSIGALSVFLDATANFGMFNVGGSAAYLSGDDPSTSDKIEGGINTAGLDWNPCLIMFNNDLRYWAGNIAGHGFSPFINTSVINTSVDSEMANAWFFQGRVGVKPTPKWDIMTSLSYAKADKKPGVYTWQYFPFPDDGYGCEVDITGTYKITNNLTYMLGAGYLFTGDYFKGLNTMELETSKVNNEYIFINKLTLSF
jgi:hypothetical protein